MGVKRLSVAVALIVILDSLTVISQTKELPHTTNVSPCAARFEHVAFNVSDPQAVVQWYSNNLGMRVIHTDGPPTYWSVIADSGMNMMFEFQHQGTYPLFNPESLHHMSLHVAFVTPDIVQTQKAIQEAGATLVDSLKTLSSGDQIVTLRDPWGLAIQFVHRKSSMLDHKGLYPEHIAMNTTDSRIRAKWYTDNLGFIAIQAGKAPPFAIFTSDANKNLMFELYQFTQYPVIDFQSIDVVSYHIGFVVDQFEKAKDCLIKAGAVLVDIHTTALNDSVLVMRDPWGLPVHIVKRVNPMIK